MSEDFDPRTFGFKNNRQLFKSLNNDFELIYHKDGSTISIKEKK